MNLPVPSRNFRWWPAALLLGMMTLLIVLTWVFASDITWKVYRTWQIVPITVILLVLWWVFASGVSWHKRLIGLSVFGGLVGIFILFFRFQGFDGAVIPTFSYRWKTTHDEARKEYFETQLADLIENSSRKPRDSQKAVSIRSNDDISEISQLDEQLIPVITQGVETDWPQFRGPDRDGIVKGVTLETNWEKSPPKLIWKHPVGEGWGAFAVLGKFAVTQEQHDNLECVICYNAETGEPVWVHTDQADFRSALGGNGPRATPTLTGNRVYSLGATGILNCLSLQSGELLWQRNILKDAAAENLGWGMAASPLVLETEQLVIVNPGGENGKSVIAYHMDDGEIVWASGSSPAGYHAPRKEVLDGVPQVLVFHGDCLAAYSVDKGELLWKFRWENTFQINVAQPIVREEKYVFLSSGYASGSALLQIERNTSGEWENPFETVWKQENVFKLKFNDAVFRNGYVYGLDEGILSCIDYKTGERMWKKGRYQFGQILLFDDTILVISEKGELALVEATPEGFHELASFPALEGKSWNHPAFANGRLYVRNGQEAACYELPCRSQQ